MRQKSPVTVPPRGPEINERSLLIVQCNEDTRQRAGGEKPRVLIDGEEVGVVDDRIFLLPGSYLVSVRQGQHYTPTLPCTLPAGKAVVLEHKSQLTPMIIVPILFGVVGILLTFATRAVPDVSPRFVSFVVLAGLVALLLFAEHCGIRLRYAERLKQRRGSPSPLVHWLEERPKDKEGRSSPAQPGRIVVHLCVEPLSFGPFEILNPTPKVYIDDNAYVGPAAQVWDLPAGKHSVQVRGYLERSSHLPIQVEPGELVELEVSRTGTGFLAMLALAVPAGGSVIAMIYYQPLINWAFLLMLCGFTVGAVAALLVTRLGHTLELQSRR